MFPVFASSDMSEIKGLQFSELDKLGRCGTASALITPDTLATEERGSIGYIKPSGWKQKKYEGYVNSQPPYLYNRCHLIAFMFYGNATNDERNLITGTRYFNTEAMLPYEIDVADYVRTTGDSVRYRVTPEYDGDGLLAKGVTIEAESCNEGGLEFSVYCENIQPGIHLDYQTGDSWIEEDEPKIEQDTVPVVTNFIGNKNSRVFHLPDCKSVTDMKEKNKEYLSCTRDEAVEHGWKPCGNCNP